MDAKPNELKELEYIEMNGPVEVVVKVHVMTPDLKTKGMAAATLEFMMESGIVPSKVKMQSMIDAIAGQPELPAGTRLMSKPEFIEKITKRETGTSIPMPGKQEFVRASFDIPREMMLHAICGVPFKTLGLNDEFVKRGFAELCSDAHNGGWRWKPAALDALTDDQLMSLYREAVRG